MPANPRSFLTAGLLTGAVLILASLPAAGDAPSAGNSDAFPVFDNFVTFTGRAAWVTGNKAAFQTNTRSAKDGTGGIENFQLNKDLSKDVTVKSDGHALAGADDYLAHFNITKDEVGSFDTGYKRFRTFYDGIGGFFPSNNAWMPLPDQDLHVDRARFWAEGMINLPDKPAIMLRYTHEVRNGRKDTTIWGDTDATGIPIYSNSNVASRKLIPDYIDLDEHHQIIEAVVKQTVGKTTYEVSLVEDLVNNLDTRYINRYPGEVKPFPAIPKTPVIVIPSSAANNAIFGFDQQGIKSNSFAATTKVETIVNDVITVHGGVRYQHSTDSITGYRPLQTSIATSLGIENVVGGVVPGSYPLGAYQNLAGGSKAKVLTGNIGAEIRPTSDLFIEPELKVESRFTQGSDSFLAVSNTVTQATGAIKNNSAVNYANQKVVEDPLTPAINLRYTGINDLALYASADYRYLRGSKRTTPQYTVTPAIDFENLHENHGHYTVGANWTPCQFFSLRAETFYKDHQNNFQDYATSDPGQYVFGYQLYGGKITAVVNPMPTLTFTTRYILQSGKMEVATDAFAQYDSMDAKSHQIGETIDWTPIRQFYLQGNFNLVFDTISTAYPRAGGVANNTVQNSDDNYWDASLIAGYALDKLTDAEAEFTYYRANNYQPALLGSVPYGAGAKDYTITAGLKRKLTEQLIISGKVGYLVSRNDTTGGFTNYTARVAYLSLEHAF